MEALTWTDMAGETLTITNNSVLDSVVLALRDGGDDSVEVEVYVTEGDAVDLVAWLVERFKIPSPMPPEEWATFLKEVKNS